MPTVTVIEPKKRQQGLASLDALIKRKVVGYARVSTDDQENSYDAQVDYFTNFIKSRPDWEFVRMYSDEGVSGTGAARRPGFEQMIKDALAGNFSLIVTKSISRFARNTVTTLSAVRDLKAHGCEVWFQKENIQTFDSKGELLITIMSSLSQEESRSISENVSWGIRKSFADGKVPFAYKHFLGYRRGADGKPELDPEEAEVVRTIYRRYLEGDSPATIARSLTAADIPTPGGKTKWAVSTVQSILSNERYKGMAILQKGFTTDFLTKKKKKNEGELPQYKVEGSHPAIIPEETWELVQLEMERRSRLGSRFSSKGLLSSRLVCADCGGFFGSKVWHSTDKNRTVIWRCNNKYNHRISRSSGETKCSTAHVTEGQIMAAFNQVVTQLYSQRPEVIAACEAVVSQLLDTRVEDTKLAKAHEEAEALAVQVKALIDAQAHGNGSEGFKEKYTALERQYALIQERIRALETSKADKTFRAKEAQAFLMAMEGFEKLSDTELFNALVDRVVVGDGLKFILRDGTEYGVR